MALSFMKRSSFNKKNSYKGKQILLCTSGTILEWYDFSLFACLSPILAKVFFPEENQHVALINTFLVFAVGFIIRPIGAAFFGHIGDKVGRKATLFATIILMTIATTGIGLIPTKTLGSISLALIFIILRLAQGLAASGEYPGGITMLAELASPSKRGLITSLGIFSAIMGAMLGSLISTGISLLITQEQMIAWGWRIPFLLGAPLGIVGLLLRYKINESSIFESEKEKGNLSKVPFLDIIKNNRFPFIQALTLYILASVGFYINFVYLTNTLVSIGKIETTDALKINFLCNFIYILFIPISGYFSDIIGRKNIMRVAALVLTLLAFPLIYMIFTFAKPYIIFSQAIIAFLMAIYLGPLAAYTAEIFPTNIRYSAVALALNLPNAIFGGLTPVICTLLVSSTNNIFASAFYFMATSIIAFIGISISRRQRVVESSFDLHFQT